MFFDSKSCVVSVIERLEKSEVRKVGVEEVKRG